MSDQKDEKPVVFMKCTRGSDPSSAGSTCSSRKAYKLSADGVPTPMFKCVTCGHTWSIPLGGAFHL